MADKTHIELPPAAFTNLVNKLKDEGVLFPGFTFTKWRQSIEWRCFVAGNNYAVEKIRSRASQLHNMEEPDHVVFGKEE